MAKDQTSKRIITSATRRALIIGVTLSLFFAQVAWAAAACLCDHQTESEIRYCHCEHHRAPAHQSLHGVISHGNSDSHFTTVHSGNGATKDAVGGNDSPPSAAICCRLKPPASEPVIPTAVQETSAVEEVGPITVHEPSVMTVPAGIDRPPRSRLIYLSLSSLLI